MFDSLIKWRLSSLSVTFRKHTSWVHAPLFVSLREKMCQPEFELQKRKRLQIKPKCLQPPNTAIITKIRKAHVSPWHFKSISSPSIYILFHWGLYVLYRTSKNRTLIIPVRIYICIPNCIPMLRPRYHTPIFPLKDSKLCDADTQILHLAMTPWNFTLLALRDVFLSVVQCLPPAPSDGESFCTNLASPVFNRDWMVVTVRK